MILRMKNLVGINFATLNVWLICFITYEIPLFPSSVTHHAQKKTFTTFIYELTLLYYLFYTASFRLNGPTLDFT